MTDALTDDEIDELQERLDERQRQRNESEIPEQSMPPLAEPWNSGDDWTSISPVADRIIDETKNVEFVDEAHSRASDPDGTVVVTLERDGEEASLRFPVVKWLNDTGRTALFDQYRQKFGENLAIDARDWGIIQYRWLHRYQSTHHAQA